MIVLEFAFWLGFSLTVLTGELWIRYTRYAVSTS
jgi:hypothetical protein